MITLRMLKCLQFVIAIDKMLQYYITNKQIHA